MAHWAEIDENNLVLRVIVGSNFERDEGEHFVKNILGGTWIKTSINTSGGVHYSQEVDEGDNPIPSGDQAKALRKNYAGIGHAYDEDRDAFIPPTPYPSWVLDEDTCLWVAPVLMPTDGVYSWDEETTAWVEDSLELEHPVEFEEIS